MKKPIKLIVIDVDGTITDGSIVYGNEDIETKAFSVKDGLILKHMPIFGIDILFLTGRSSGAMKRRAADLKCALIENAENKEELLRDFISDRGLTWIDTAYIGDDLNDYRAMKLCGFRACPANGVEKIKEICDYISPRIGGDGAVRDICEVILKEQGLWERFIEYWV